MNQLEKIPAAAVIRNSIPEDEAVFYENVSSDEVAQLASLNSIDDISRVSSALSFAALARIFKAKAHSTLPDPMDLWCAATFECVAEYEAMKFVAPVRGKTVLQLGGKGTEAVKFMLAGARAAYLVSPVESELSCAKELARLCGVDIECKLGLAEEIPFADEFFDAIYTAGCAHHFKTDQAFPEIRRVLRPGGRFAAIEPWRAPFYSMGIKIFGKREEEVHCRPLTNERLGNLSDYFSFNEVRQHGSITRYPMIAFGKLGLMTPLALAWWITKMDDAFCSLFHLRSYGSCAAILAEK
jgi:ubiquinone/menaquinone biosynthesis C-methylase UbiE